VGVVKERTREVAQPPLVSLHITASLDSEEDPVEKLIKLTERRLDACTLQAADPTK